MASFTIDTLKQDIDSGKYPIVHPLQNNTNCPDCNNTFNPSHCSHYIVLDSYKDDYFLVYFITNSSCCGNLLVNPNNYYILNGETIGSLNYITTTVTKIPITCIKNNSLKGYFH